MSFAFYLSICRRQFPDWCEVSAAGRRETPHLVWTWTSTGALLWHSEGHTERVFQWWSIPHGYPGSLAETEGQGSQTRCTQLEFPGQSTGTPSGQPARTGTGNCNEAPKGNHLHGISEWLCTMPLWQRLQIHQLIFGFYPIPHFQWLFSFHSC